jgi:hypothetical protein
LGHGHWRGRWGQRGNIAHRSSCASLSLASTVDIEKTNDTWFSRLVSCHTACSKRHNGWPPREPLSEGTARGRRERHCQAGDGHDVRGGSGMAGRPPVVSNGGRGCASSCGWRWDRPGRREIRMLANDSPKLVFSAPHPPSWIAVPSTLDHPSRSSCLPPCIDASVASTEVSLRRPESKAPKRTTTQHCS